VSASGNVKVGPHQFWVGPAHAGRRLGFRMDTTTVHLSLDGVHLKTVPSRQTKEVPRTNGNGVRDRVGQEPSPVSRCRTVTQLLSQDTIGRQVSGTATCVTHRLQAMDDGSTAPARDRIIAGS
jgi:hypothetical protein